MGEAMEDDDGIRALEWQALSEPDFRRPLKWAESEGAFYILSLSSPRFCFQAGTLGEAVERARQALIFYHEHSLMTIRSAPPLPEPPNAARSTEEGE